jgi:hypothetical protein
VPGGQGEAEQEAGQGQPKYSHSAERELSVLYGGSVRLRHLPRGAWIHGLLGGHIHTLVGRQIYKIKLLNILRVCDYSLHFSISTLLLIFLVYFEFEITAIPL